MMSMGQDAPTINNYENELEKILFEVLCRGEKHTYRKYFQRNRNIPNLNALIIIRSLEKGIIDFKSPIVKNFTRSCRNEYLIVKEPKMLENLNLEELEEHELSDLIFYPIKRLNHISKKGYDSVQLIQQVIDAKIEPSLIMSFINVYLFHIESVTVEQMNKLLDYACYRGIDNFINNLRKRRSDFSKKIRESEGELSWIRLSCIFLGNGGAYDYMSNIAYYIAWLSLYFNMSTEALVSVTLAFKNYYDENGDCFKRSRSELFSIFDELCNGSNNDLPVEWQVYLSLMNYSKE